MGHTLKFLLCLAGLAAVSVIFGLQGYIIQNHRPLGREISHKHELGLTLNDDNCSILTSFASLPNLQLKLPSSFQDFEARWNASYRDLSEQIAKLQAGIDATSINHKLALEKQKLQDELARSVAEVHSLKHAREWWMNDTRDVFRTSTLINFDVVITTIPRQDGTALLRALINNLLGVGVTNDIYLSYGRPETSEMRYLQALVDDFRDIVTLKVLHLSEEVWAKVDKRSIAAKTAANEWQALTVDTHGKHLVRLEDDVQLASFFNVRLSRVIKDLQRVIPGRAYVLDLCVPYNMLSLPEIVHGVVLYPEGKFWGTQGLMFSPEALDAGVGQYYYNTGVESEPTGLQDMMLKDFIIQKNGYNLTDGKVLLLALTHSLVQHVGLKSTRGGSDSSWQVENFVDNMKY